MKPSNVALAIESSLKAGLVPMVWGAPGVGKSSVVAQIAVSMGYDSMIDIRALLLDPVDIRGVPVPAFVINGEVVPLLAADGSMDADMVTKWANPGFLPTDGKHLIFFDELPNAPPLVQASLLQFILKDSQGRHKVGDYTLPQGCGIVAAGNRVEDKAGVHKLISSLSSRFAPHLDFESDLDDWVDIAFKHNYEVSVIGYNRFKGGRSLNVFEPKSNPRCWPNPRSWQFISDLIKQNGTVPQSVRIDMFKGIIGEGEAIEFAAWLDVYKKIPNLDNIILNPKTAPVPDESDHSITYAVCVGLAGRANPNNMPNIVEYAARLPKEFETLLVIDATRKDEGNLETGAFVQWANDNSSVFMGGE